MENIEDIILNQVLKNRIIKVSDIVLLTGFSRIYIQRIFAKLVNDKVIKKIGSTKNSLYVLGNSDMSASSYIKILKNKDLKEDLVLLDVEKKLELKNKLNKSSLKIFEFAFSEILNNAIDHSKSEKIGIRVGLIENKIFFEINDNGIGIFYNIIKEYHLNSIDDAVSFLLKGKNTTNTENHSGQGIFFTSRMSDIFEIFGDKKKIIFDNNTKDVFLKNNRDRKGTKIYFEISVDSSKIIKDVFDEYTDSESSDFNKTEAFVKLYTGSGSNMYVSRSEARRILFGIDNFKILKLDFKGIDTIGQSFADEIFGVFLRNNPDKKVEYVNASDNVEFMIKKAIEENKK